MEGHAPSCPKVNTSLNRKILPHLPSLQAATERGPPKPFPTELAVIQKSQLHSRNPASKVPSREGIYGYATKAKSRNWDNFSPIPATPRTRRDAAASRKAVFWRGTLRRARKIFPAKVPKPRRSAALQSFSPQNWRLYRNPNSIYGTKYTKSPPERGFRGV